jgi:Kef-type K+ transport system membrane component KefB
MKHAETLLYLLADLVIIILLARSFGALARRIGQPSVIGEVVAGIVLGPTVLGRFFADLPGFLFPKHVPLKEIADLGLVFFMFLVGLDMNTGLMKREGRKSVVISTSGIALPFGMGMVLAWFLAPVNSGGRFLEGTSHPPTTFTFAIFLGASMCITAFPILARYLVETGLYKTPVGTSALCAAAVDDAIAWILLAAVIGITKTGSALNALPALMLTVLYAAFMFTAGRRLLAGLAKRYDATGALTIDQVAIVLAGVLLSAFATEKIGIHAIFGAFIFGIVMPKRSGITQALTEKVEDFTVIVLLPVFFAVVGLRTNLLTLNSPSLLGWLGLILAVATASKFIGTGLAARLTGSTMRDSIIVGALMNTRGLTELVILSIGLSLGVLSDVTFAMMVIMALTTTVIAAPIVNRLASRGELIGTLVRSTAKPGAPTEEAAFRVLVAIGNPLNAPALVSAAIRLTGNIRPAELLLVKLIPSPRAPEFNSGLLEVDRQVAAVVEDLAPLEELAEAAGLSAHPVSFLSENVGIDLAGIAADQKCNLILLGWHRALLQRHIVRALVFRTFAAAPCDVAVFADRTARGLALSDTRPVLAMLSGQEHDLAACEVAARLATSLGTNLRLGGPLRDGGRFPDFDRHLAECAAALGRWEGLSIQAAPLREPVQEAFAEESAKAAACVMVVGDDWRVKGVFGDPTALLAETAACPILVVCARSRAATPVTPTRMPKSAIARE